MTASFSLPIPVGLHPYGVAFDGASIWVANADDDTLTKLRAHDGSLEGTFEVGDSPIDPAFDGKDIWVTEFLGSTVARVSGRTGVVRDRFVVDDLPVGIAFAGASIWTAGYSDKVDKISKGP